MNFWKNVCILGEITEGGVLKGILGRISSRNNSWWVRLKGIFKNSLKKSSHEFLQKLCKGKYLLIFFEELSDKFLKKSLEVSKRKKMNMVCANSWALLEESLEEFLTDFLTNCPEVYVEEFPNESLQKLM